mmetsp:Transcript_8938/g.28374  ORF Transcript_8938/g.28374 Transcript_8938/m.28374 type:complete len:230 (-) Transcript_8938:23-712(-)
MKVLGRLALSSRRRILGTSRPDPDLKRQLLPSYSAGPSLRLARSLELVAIRLVRSVGVAICRARRPHAIDELGRRLLVRPVVLVVGTEHRAARALLTLDALFLLVAALDVLVVAALAWDLGHDHVAGGRRPSRLGRRPGPELLRLDLHLVVVGVERLAASWLLEAVEKTRRVLVVVLLLLLEYASSRHPHRSNCLCLADQRPTASVWRTNDQPSACAAAALILSMKGTS